MYLLLVFQGEEKGEECKEGRRKRGEAGGERTAKLSFPFSLLNFYFPLPFFV